MGISNRRTECREYESFLDDVSPAAAGEAVRARMEQHLRECADCAARVEDAAIVGRLLRFASEPVQDPGPFFTRRVMASVRSEEEREAVSATSFWKPLEILSFRAAWTAAAALVLLVSYGVVSQRSLQSSQPMVAEVRAADSYALFPETSGPLSNQDDALMPVVDANYGK
jgi:hypothetical protein